MRILHAACLILGGALSLHGQGGASGSETTVNPGGRNLYALEGRVLADGGRLPLQGVRVTVTSFKGASRASSSTNMRGAFAFNNLPIGQYTLTVSHPDYNEQSQQVELNYGGQRDLQIVMFRRRGASNAPPGPTVGVRALQIPERARKEYSQGLEALQKGQRQQSIAHFQAAIQLYPQFAAAYGALGSAQVIVGDKQAATAAFEKALEIDENLPGACLGLATLYAQERRYADAEKQLLRARMLKPDEWRVHYQLGELYWQMGDWAKAEVSLRRGSELHQEFPRLHLLLLNVLALQEKYPDALAEMERFLKLFPQDSFAPQVRQKRDLLQAQIEKTGVARPANKP